MENNEGLEKAIEEFRAATQIGYTEVIAWERMLSHPLDRLRFYWELTTEQNASSGKTYAPGVHGYVRGQFFNAESSARQLETTDSLTGLLNSRGYFMRMEEIMSKVRRDYTDGRRIAVAFIDVNNFKEQANDKYGHQFGNDVLRYVADGIKRCTRPGDIKARVGGDEFVIVFDPFGTQEPEKILEDLNLRINNHLQKNIRLHHSDKTSDVGVSVGLSIFGVDANDADELLYHADQAMYHAKSNPLKSSTDHPTELNYHLFKKNIKYVSREERRGRG